MGKAGENLKLLIDIAGVRFGRLVAIERAGKSKSGNSLWLCKCECGKEVVVNISNLRNGHTQSCGCYASELRKHRKTRTTHGMSYSRLYRIWKGIKQRCNDPKCTGYQHYGGKGISICDEWKNSFEAFDEWATANGYTDDLTIDRIDPNGNYEPSNCRWADTKEQSRNKSTTAYLTLNGETKSMAEWHEILGIPFSTMVNRKRKGLPDELILSKDYLKSGKSKEDAWQSKAY